MALIITNSFLFSIAGDFNCILFSIAGDFSWILFSIACDRYFGTDWRIFLQANFDILGRQSWCAMEIGNVSENKQIFKSERHELLLHAHLQFLTTIWHGLCTDWQQRLLAAFRFFSCTFCITFVTAQRVFRRVFVLLKNKNFSTINKFLF